MANEVTIAGAGELGQAGRTVANPAYSYLAHLADTGRRTRESTLKKVAGMLGGELDSIPWAELRYQHVTAIRTMLTERGLAPATVNKYLAAVRGVMREAWRLGLVDAETYQRIVAVEGVKGETLPSGRGLGPGELAALMRICANDHTPAGARDAAIIAMGYGAGLRRAELAGLDLADLADDGEIITATIRGKGSKERLVYLDNGSAQALRDWQAVRGGQPGALFYRGRNGGHLIAGKRLSGQAIRNILKKRADDAGLENATPHDVRRSFVSDLLEAGVDIATVANMAGHANIETTRRYDRRGEAAKRKAARALHVPYQKRGLER
jgi:site-specific recombinase XerD